MKKLLSIFIILMLCLTPCYASSQNLTSSQKNHIKNELYRSINKERKKPVRLYSPLKKTTQLRAKEAYIKWSHTRPNNQRWNTTLKSIKVNIKRTPHGENLAKLVVPYQNIYSQEDIKTITNKLHQALVSSPSHYKVMTNPQYHKVNIGLYSQKVNNTLVITIAQHYLK